MDGNQIRHKVFSVRDAYFFRSALLSCAQPSEKGPSRNLFEVAAPPTPYSELHE